MNLVPLCKIKRRLAASNCDAEVPLGIVSHEPRAHGSTNRGSAPCLNDARVRVAFVGASGYGNTGDDAYVELFKRRYGAGHDLFFYNSDLPRDLPRVDLVVFGGGGLIYSPRGVPANHFARMAFYLNRAMEYGIPFGFVSCGVQVRRAGDGSWDTAALQPWAPFLSSASFVTVRSPSCLEVVKELGAPGGAAYFPDLCYLLGAGRARTPRKNLVIVPTTTLFKRHPEVVTRAREYLNRGYQVVFLRMGAVRDDKPVFGILRRLFDGATFKSGAGIEECLETIGSAEMVITGRYHGVVLARALGVPVWHSDVGPYKIVVEPHVANPRDAMGHFDVLDAAIERCAKGRNTSY